MEEYDKGVKKTCIGFTLQYTDRSQIRWVGIFSNLKSEKNYTLNIGINTLNKLTYI